MGYDGTGQANQALELTACRVSERHRFSSLCAGFKLGRFIGAAAQLNRWAAQASNALVGQDATDASPHRYDVSPDSHMVYSNKGYCRPWYAEHVHR
jgi:hypothetical protein